ncbi:MAG: ribulose-phosphate 3-epimerase [Acidaminococcus sp.]|nr:ribulose-phosphate 3-epimerase [Acidaminococcus sp.]MDD7398443.1 ribulose-phosphate 3-epimerase [Bacillota bacterium]MDY4559682.1 ribulose-phosphate 3-epimerase [Eubacteriales bacterium]
MTKPLVAPSILSADFANMEKAALDVRKWGGDWLHCDVMDGVFVPNITFGMPMVKALDRVTDMTLDVHLMITEPEKYVERFCDVGADFVTFHVDASKNVDGALDAIKAKGKKCGLVLNPDKPLSLVKPYIDKIDMLLIMSVYAGFGGQKFIPESVQKLKDAKKLIGDRNVLLEIDGGVGEDNAKEIIAAGADVLVAGSSVFGSKNPEKVISALKGIE